MNKDREAIKQDLAQYYDGFAHDYEEINYRRKRLYSPLQYRQRYIEEMIEHLDLPRGAAVLDAGCGPGGLTLSLLKKGYDVWAVDISQVMADDAIKRINANGYPDWKQMRVGDIEELEFGDSFFDVVVAAGVIEYQKDDEKALAEFQRVLKTDRYLIVNVTNKYSPMVILGRPYTWLKSQPIGTAIFNFLKERILRRGQISQIPSRRTHSPRKFNRSLTEMGLKIVSHNYFGFSPLPSPFSELLIRVCEPVGAWMENLTSSPFGFLGGGYLVLTRNCR